MTAIQFGSCWIPGSWVIKGELAFFTSKKDCPSAKENAIDRIPVPHQIFWRSVPGEGLHDFPDKIADYTTDAGPSRTFGFEFPEKLKPLAVPTDSGIRLYNDKRFAPRMPNSGKHNPKEPIGYSNFRPLVHPFHDGQLLAQCDILNSKIQGDFDLRPHERNKNS
jgi:hypothetical protein